MVVADVEGNMAAMGDGCSEAGCSEAGWPPAGRGPMEIMRGRVLRTSCRGWGGVGMPSAEDNGAMAGCLGAGDPRHAGAGRIFGHGSSLSLVSF